MKEYRIRNGWRCFPVTGGNSRIEYTGFSNRDSGAGNYKIEKKQNENIAKM